MKVNSLRETDKIRSNDSAENRLAYLVSGFEELDSKQQIEVLDMICRLSNSEETA